MDGCGEDQAIFANYLNEILASSQKQDVTEDAVALEALVEIHDCNRLDVIGVNASIHRATMRKQIVALILVLVGEVVDEMDVVN